MDSNDPRVKELQQQAWQIQTLGNKPASRLPEDFKHHVYKYASRATQLCTDAPYMAEQDFLDRAAIFKVELAAKRLEIEAKEKEVEESLYGKCYKPGGGGTYTVGFRADEDKQTQETASPIQPGEDLGKSHGSLGISAEEVTGRCAQNPEELSLSGLGLCDADLVAVCSSLAGPAGIRLRSLDLSNNQLADSGVQRLVSELARGVCPELCDLYLAGNNIGELGSRMLKDGLGALRKKLVVHTEATTPSSPRFSASLQPPAPAKAPELKNGTDQLSTPDLVSAAQGQSLSEMD